MKTRMIHNQRLHERSPIPVETLACQSRQIFIRWIFKGRQRYNVLRTCKF